jgi:hypothetical protein
MLPHNNAVLLSFKKRIHNNRHMQNHMATVVQKITLGVYAVTATGITASETKIHKKNPKVEKRRRSNQTNTAVKSSTITVAQ